MNILSPVLVVLRAEELPHLSYFNSLPEFEPSEVGRGHKRTRHVGIKMTTSFLEEVSGIFKVVIDLCFTVDKLLCEVELQVERDD